MRGQRVGERSGSEGGADALRGRLAVERRALAGDAAGGPDQALDLLRGQLLSELRPGGTRDRLVHQRPAKVVDAGVQRTDSLTTGNFSNGAATLYAYDALTMQPLWSSPYQQLDMGGKYNTLAVAGGVAFVGTDRIQAFGLTTNTSIDAPAFCGVEPRVSTMLQ